MWNYIWSHEGYTGVLGFDDDGNFHPEETQIHIEGRKHESFTPKDLSPSKWENIKNYLVKFANRIIKREGWDTPELTMDDLIHPEEV